MNIAKYVGVVSALSITVPALAAAPHGSGHGATSGEAGMASGATRTIAVEMHDNYYEPESIRVKPGETVRFVIDNKGGLVHEFNIDTAGRHEAHQKEMQMMVDHGVIKGDHINHDMMDMDMGNGQTMKHDAPNSLLMAPGERKEMIWTFTEASDLEFACNVPGHYQAGMVGDITFE